MKKNKLNFLDYFDSFRLRREHIFNSDENVNALDFTIETYNDTIERIEKIRPDNFYSPVDRLEDLVFYYII